MQRINALLLLVCSLLILPENLSATTIRPFLNLGEMAKHSEAVVLVRAERNYTVEENGMTRFRTALRVLNTVSGPLQRDDQFILQNLHIRFDDIERTIWGDLELEAGKNYLLFLTINDYGEWKPMMLSYGALEENYKDGEHLLVPISLGAEVSILRTGDGRLAEPLQVYRTDEFIQHLRSVVDDRDAWDKARVATDHEVSSFSTNERAAPSHCTYLSGSPIARWNGFPTALPVYYHTGGDSGCSSAFARIQGAIGTMNGTYLGINLTDGGTHGFVPSCVGQGATDGEFTSYAASNLGSRSLTIQFDDPCNEITDLIGCNGTLGIGGLYWSSVTHTWDGVDWRTALYGYVVVNNGTGACQCVGASTDYDVMITHEMTHSLGINHIATSDGIANMNPSCCNVIQPLDIECLDYTYLAALPVELISFDGVQVEKAIQLNWATAQESDNEAFILERSSNGKDFEALTTVEGAGTTLTSQRYHHLDRDPQFGTNYYRLSQVDYDGSLTVVEYVAVDYFDGQKIQLSPNPYRGGLLNVDISLEKSADMDIQIFDIMGNSVFSNNYRLDRGQNSLPLNLDHLPEGTYILRTGQKNNHKTLRFVKIN
ncbi:MAG: T9SS type A sorting domain-containing protein [Bacteroidota bacterium]